MLNSLKDTSESKPIMPTDRTIENAQKRVTVIVPSYDPDEKLETVVSGLEAAGFDDIIVVNDGSHDDKIKYFPDPEAHPAMTLLTHEGNRGKGAAMKTAFAWFLANRKDREGVVTADGDAQHRVCDILGCAESMLATGGLVLGVRDFSGPDVPKRSRMGNKITSTVFRLLCGLHISDTQTGLRAFPTATLPGLINVDGDRYEYETNMLLALKGLGIHSSERKIETVYIEENQTSHFRPVRDSLRIYSLILKFVLSSCAATVVDLLVFYLINLLFREQIGDNVLIPTAIARVISAFANFTINRKLVFRSKDKVSLTLLKYTALAVPVMLASAGGVRLLVYAFKIEMPFVKTACKMVIDTILYFLNFRIQQNWVFKNADKSKNK